MGSFLKKNDVIGVDVGGIIHRIYRLSLSESVSSDAQATRMAMNGKSAVICVRHALKYRSLHQCFKLWWKLKWPQGNNRQHSQSN